MIELNIRMKQIGFTLIEMAMVLVILGFVLGALLLPLQAQRQQLAQAQTENTLENAKQALLGFAQRNGRLPCPATNNGTATFPDDTGTANPNASGACTQLVGFLPATSLGIQPTDAQGFAMDAWNNRIRYAVTSANTNAFTTNNAMNTIGLAALTPDFRVCATSTAANCTATINLINEAVAVIYSMGATFTQGSGGADENANLNNDAVFVSHDVTAAGAANGEFDHMVVWISPFVLYNAMIQAGQLH
ncbi:MAG: type II secretion system protein [Methylotenera sp.]